MESPGTLCLDSSTVRNLSTADYYAVVEQYAPVSLHMKLIEMGQEQFNQYDFNDEKYPCGLTYGELSELENYYLYNYRGFSQDDISIESVHNGAASVKAYIVEQVKKGIPVLVTMGKASGGGHAFIIYDYDETTGELYCNMGWKGNYEHKALSSTSYTRFWSATTFVPHMNRSVSNNYVSTASDGSIEKIYTPNVYETPYRIDLDPEYTNVAPTVAWSYLERPEFLNSETFNLVFYDEHEHEMFRIENLTGSKYQFSDVEWGNIIAINGPTFYIQVEACGPDGTDKLLSALCNIDDPIKVATVQTIKSDEFGFAQRYYFDEKETHMSLTGLDIDVKRLRCGYISNQYLVLSPRRQKAGAAYLELDFDAPVYAFAYSLSYWSNKEYYKASDCTIVVEVLDANGNWTLLKDVLADTSIKTKEDGFVKFTNTSEEGIKGIRFSATTPAVGSKNKGRICIGDIDLDISK